MLTFDEEAGRRLVATYSTPDVVEQRRVVREALALRSGEHVLDVGSGPGLLAAEMAAEVGPDGSITGVDPSASMIAMAERTELAPGAAPIAYVEGDACVLPLEDGRFDAAVSTQVYEYVPDVPAALAEAHRVLKPSGRLLVLDTDWDSIVWHSADPERMRRVLAAWDEHLADPYLPRRLPRLLADAGFTLTHYAALPMFSVGFEAKSFSAGVISLIAAFVPGRHGLTEQDAQAWADELRAQADDFFFSVNRYLFVATR